jgi:hypothetical protein
MHTMTEHEFSHRRDSYKNRTAIVALLVILAIPFSIAFTFRYANGGELLFLFACCVLIPLLGYIVFARYLARQMGLTCASCGRRIISQADVTAGRCRHCGGLCVDDAA